MKRLIRALQLTTALVRLFVDFVRMIDALIRLLRETEPMLTAVWRRWLGMSWGPS